MRLRTVTLLLVLAASVVVASPPAAIFVAIGDQHSAYSRTAQFVAAVDRVQQDNPGVPLAVLINGDLFEAGNVIAQRSGGAIDLAMVTALARRAPTVVNLGNHEAEFHDLPTTVAQLRAAGAIVIGDIADLGSGELLAPASTELPLGADRAVVVGLATHLLAQYRSTVRATIDVPNPVAWARTRWPELWGGASIRVVMSHAGVRADRDILPEVPDGTLYLGAHDHLRFVHRSNHTVYVHSGSWNGCLSVIRLRRNNDGTIMWEVDQQAIAVTDAADPELAALIEQTRMRHLRPEDTEIIGRLAVALPREAAALRVVREVRTTAGADAAFIGNTTFGDGLPGGPVRRVDLDACVRFDGTICVAEVDGAQLQAWMVAANQGADTPFEQRRGEFLFADGPAEIVANRRYRVATTDWGVRNRGRYFGSEALVFVEHPELRLKAIVARSLHHEPVARE